jgi:hypothetical protein
MELQLFFTVPQIVESFISMWIVSLIRPIGRGDGGQNPVLSLCRDVYEAVMRRDIRWWMRKVSTGTSDYASFVLVEEGEGRYPHDIYLICSGLAPVFSAEFIPKVSADGKPIIMPPQFKPLVKIWPTSTVSVSVESLSSFKSSGGV